MKKIITSFLLLFFCLLGLTEPVLASIKPNDPFYGNQWYLAKIKADNAWEKISASPDIVIAVIDSGIDINHPDLRDNIWSNLKEIPNNKIDDDQNGFIDDVNGWDFVNNSSDPRPKFSSNWTEAGVSHGTMVAGVIAARGNNEEGITGVTWRAKIMALKVLGDSGEGRISSVVRAIDYAINNNADIINLSFVSFDYSEALQEAIARAHAAGVIIVAAAGNDQANGEGYNIDQNPIYPACYDGDLGENMVIGVAATDALDQKAKFSSYGFRCVDLSAPGISFFSAITPGSDSNSPNKIYDGYWSGTSMATALVSGSLALIQQANPELSRREVVNILFASTDNISRLNPNYLGQLGNGRLNLNSAVEMSKERLYSNVGRLVVLPFSGNKVAKLTAVSGNIVKTYATSTLIKNASSFSSGDLNNDGQAELVLGTASGQEPRVKIFNTEGKLLKQFLVGDKRFPVGVNLALADVNGDNNLEIITVGASNSSSEIKIFDFNGRLLKQFLAFSKNWRGGLNISVGDLDGKGDPEIVVAPTAGKEPQVKIFTTAGDLVGAFYAYEKSFRGGVKVAVANIDGRADHNKSEIIVAPGSGREPLIKIFNNYAQLKKQFLAYSKNWRSGFSLVAGDLNNDGLAEIATGANPGAAPHVRVFSGQGELLESFYAWEEGFKGGVNLGIIKVNN